MVLYFLDVNIIIFLVLIAIFSMNFLRKFFGFGERFYYDKFMEAIENGDFDNTKLYFKKEFLNRKNIQGRQPIHVACLIENIEIIKFLIENKCNTELLDNVCPPFHYVYKKGNLEIIKYLLQNKLGMEVEDVLGMRPLHWACLKGHKEVIKLLIAYGCQLDCKTNDGLSSVDIAIQHGHDECVNLLRSAIDIVPLIRENYEKEIKDLVQNYEKIVKANFKVCTICLDLEVNCVLNCGHSFCMDCAKKFIECPNCRSKPTNPKRLFLD